VRKKKKNEERKAEIENDKEKKENILIEKSNNLCQE